MSVTFYGLTEILDRSRKINGLYKKVRNQIGWIYENFGEDMTLLEKEGINIERIKTGRNSRCDRPPTEFTSSIPSRHEWHVHPDAQPETKGIHHTVSSTLSTHHQVL